MLKRKLANSKTCEKGAFTRVLHALWEGREGCFDSTNLKPIAERGSYVACTYIHVAPSSYSFWLRATIAVAASIDSESVMLPLCPFVYELGIHSLNAPCIRPATQGCSNLARLSELQARCVRAIQPAWHVFDQPGGL